MPSTRIVKWVHLPHREYGTHVLSRLREYLFGDDSEKIRSLADWMGRTPQTVRGWINNGERVVIGGLTTPLQEGWLIRQGVEVQNPTTGLQRSLWRAVSEKLIGVEVLAERLGVQETSIIRWLYGGSQPLTLQQYRLEHLLHEQECWKEPTYHLLNPPLPSLVELLVEGGMTESEISEALSVSINQLQRWLRDNPKLRKADQGRIQELLDRQSQAHKAVPLQEEVVSSKEPTPATPAIMTPVLLMAPLPEPSAVLTSMLPWLNALLDHFIEHSTQDERDQFMKVNRESVFLATNKLAAISSDEAIRRYRSRKNGGIT